MPNYWVSWTEINQDQMQLICHQCKQRFGKPVVCPHRCPRCGTGMADPPRDYHICPNKHCFVEFGYDWPECTDDGVPYPNYDFRHLHTLRDDLTGEILDPQLRALEQTTHHKRLPE